jgi:hypothetical protein
MELSKLYTISILGLGVLVHRCTRPMGSSASYKWTLVNATHSYIVYSDGTPAYKPYSISLCFQSNITDSRLFLLGLPQSLVHKYGVLVHNN